MKIMEIIEKETKGKSYHTYKYSYDSIGLRYNMHTSLFTIHKKRIPDF